MGKENRAPFFLTTRLIMSNKSFRYKKGGVIALLAYGQDSKYNRLQLGSVVMNIKQQILNKLMTFRSDTNLEGTAVYLGDNEYQAYLHWVKRQRSSTSGRFVEGGINVGVEKSAFVKSGITVCL